VNELDVYLHDGRAGYLRRLDGARLEFAYDPSWLAEAEAPVSLSLPLREEPYQDAECRPFFAGLLPEGGFLRAIARTFHVSAGNPFSVLEEIGGECAGAISLVASDSEPPTKGAPAASWITPEELARLVAELPSRPLLAGGGDDEGIRLSLSGTRDKLPLLIEDGRTGITHGRPPSTHILKVPMVEVPEMVANEAYCLALARAIGLSAAFAEPIQAAEREALLVERYDRFWAGETVRRLHQEDLCQASGRPPEQKYESEGGPGVAECGELIRRHTAGPGASLLKFLDALLFNVLIGNSDAHSKNYSLLLDGPGAPRLAPLYDLLSTRAYGRGVSRKLAMKYGGEYRPERIRGRHLDRLGADLGIAPRRVREHAAAIGPRALAAAGEARESLPEPWRGAEIIATIESVVSEFADLLRAAAAEPR
jgi:serine/threonine-protein kinase HipA